jgi:HPt (histidine-containing phosphotransfer) domain-containing protein
MVRRALIECPGKIGEGMSALAANAAHQDQRHETDAPIDRAYLARFTLGNAALEREVLGLFAEHAPTYLLQLMAAETERAWYEAAHTLKGSARAVGAKQVALEAERAEALKGPREDGERTARIDALGTALDEVRRYIAGLDVAA